MNRRILFIDDDLVGREVALHNLKKAGYEVTAASDGREGLSLFSPEKFDLVVTDLKMPVVDGMEVLETICRTSPATPVLVITAFGNVETAVAAMKQGAADFIGKPFHREQLLLAVEKTLERRRLIEEVRALRIRSGGVEREIVHVSAAMRRLLEVTDRVAASRGRRPDHRGKRHRQGGRRAPDPRALPPGGETFRCGQLRRDPGGAAGVRAVRPQEGGVHGRLPRADREVPAGGRRDVVSGRDRRGAAAAPAEAPARPAGKKSWTSSAGTRRSARTCASSRPPTRISGNGSGRDRSARTCFYRLNVVELHVPPLSERPEDIPVLVEHFLGEMEGGKEVVIPPEVMEELVSRRWPGNVRELRNACERIAILANGREASIDDLPRARCRGARGARRSGRPDAGMAHASPRGTLPWSTWRRG